MFKNISLLAFAITAALIVLHLIVYRPAAEKKTHRTSAALGFVRGLIYAFAGISFMLLFATGFYAVVMTDQPLGGYMLMTHCTAAPVFAVTFTLSVLCVAARHLFTLGDISKQSAVPGNIKSQIVFNLIHSLIFWLLLIILPPLFISLVLWLVLSLKAVLIVLGCLTVVSFVFWCRYFQWAAFASALALFTVFAKKAAFWLLAALSLPLVLSVVSSMFPLWDTSGQKIAFYVHQYTSLVFAVLMFVYFYLAIVSRTDKKRA